MKRPNRSATSRPAVFLSAAILSLSLFSVSAAPAQVNGSLGVNEERLQGAGPDGNPLIYNPDPAQPGSSISHWDVRATPNLLMEPAINADLAPLQVDITQDAFADLGWPLVSEGDRLMKAATFNIIPLNDGFEDPTPFPGAPGNNATTLGEARANLFNAVLSGWADVLDSPVPIDVEVAWIPLPCSPQGAALAAAGPIQVFGTEDPGTLPFILTWYHMAHAEAITGAPQSSVGLNDIQVVINSSIDEGCLGDGTSFYYGTDGNNPANQVDAAPVILHELGHGLGFSSLTDEETGAQLQNLPSAYDHFLRDLDQNKTWPQMTDGERQTSAINEGRLVWNGAAATAAAMNLLEPGVPELVISGAGALDGAYDVGTASFGPRLARPLSGEIACFEDSEGEVTDACTVAANGDELQGKLVLVDRGTCSFTDKAANVQAAGGAGMILVNNAGNSVVQMGGEDTSITIPAVSVGRSVGDAIRAAACPDEPQTSIALQNGRFLVSTEWDDGSGQGAGTPVGFTDDCAYFYFFSEKNVETVVKVLDGCSISDSIWVFASGMTDVGVKLRVEYKETGAVKIYTNDVGEDFKLIKDYEAFECP